MRIMVDLRQIRIDLPDKSAGMGKIIVGSGFDLFLQEFDTFCRRIGKHIIIRQQPFYFLYGLGPLFGGEVQICLLTVNQSIENQKKQQNESKVYIYPLHILSMVI